VTDIDKARQLFRDAGLSFPAIPKALAVQLKERSPWVFSTRPLKMSPYNLQHYEQELERTLVKDYAVLAHSGHGANSYAIQYYLVSGSLRILLHLGWGGAYADSKADAARIRECFAVADQVVAAASKVQAGEQLTVVGSDFYGSYWFPSGERRRTEKPLEALTQALGWITPSRNPPPPTQLSLFAEKRRDATVRVVGRVALPKERTPKTTPSVRKSLRKRPSKSKSRRA